MPSAEFRSRLAEALQNNTVDLLLAAGELRRDDLMAWAHQAGIITANEPSDRVAMLARELSDDASPRLRLATQILWMTRDEANYQVTMFEYLPTEGHAERQRLRHIPEEFRRWRDRQDAVDGL